MAIGGTAAHQPIGGVERPAPIVEQIAAARARSRIRFRVVFALTWLVLVGGLALGIAATGRVDPEFLSVWAPYIVGGVAVTVGVSIASIIFAIVFATFGALGRLSTAAPIYAIATLYVSLVRGTPLIIQILFVYLALPQFGLSLPPIVCGIFALSFNYGAYMTEIFRAGIQAIPRGQIEAASALGMTQAMTMRRVVLPQAIRIVIPAIGNEFIAMIKDSALVSYVTIEEVFFRASTTGTRFFRSFETLLVAALIYWILTIMFSFVQERIETRLRRSDVRL
ncbi:MAG: amino acid ABC transporter permease [Chloroflexota bacterium]|jgi:polar amino acid transport system permease protein